MSGACRRPRPAVRVVEGINDAAVDADPGRGDGDIHQHQHEHRGRGHHESSSWDVRETSLSLLLLLHGGDGGGGGEAGSAQPGRIEKNARGFPFSLSGAPLRLSAQLRTVYAIKHVPRRTRERHVSFEMIVSIVSWAALTHRVEGDRERSTLGVPMTGH